MKSYIISLGFILLRYRITISLVGFGLGLSLLSEQTYFGNFNVFLNKFALDYV